MGWPWDFWTTNSSYRAGKKVWSNFCWLLIYLGTEDLNTLYVFQWVGGPNHVNGCVHKKSCGFLCVSEPHRRQIRFLSQVLLHFVGFVCFIGPTIMLELPVRHPASWSAYTSTHKNTCRQLNASKKKRKQKWQNYEHLEHKRVSICQLHNEK